MSTIQRDYKERWDIKKFEKIAAKECFDVVASCLLQLISNCIKLSSTIGRPADNDNVVTKRNNVGFNIQSEMSLSLILTQQLHFMDDYLIRFYSLKGYILPDCFSLHSLASWWPSFTYWHLPPNFQPDNLWPDSKTWPTFIHFSCNKIRCSKY